jgi:hypothetical protein
MGLPIPTMAELLRFAEKVRAERKATAEKLLTLSPIGPIAPWAIPDF